MIADSDNARQTVPLTELVAEQRMVMLPGQRDGSVGEQYGRGFEKPLVATVLPERPSRQPAAAGIVRLLARSAADRPRGELHIYLDRR